MKLSQIFSSNYVNVHEIENFAFVHNLISPSKAIPPILISNPQINMTSSPTMDWYDVRGILKIKGVSTSLMKTSKLISKNIIVKMVPRKERYI
jgi:hypothetical protein